jgi:PAS domain S-box-containing protein
MANARLFDERIVGSAEQAFDFIGDILESSTEYSVIGVDLEGKILLWSEGAHRLYGYGPEEVVGKADSSILHTPQDIAAGKPQQLLDAALQNGRWEGTICRLRKNGGQFTARVVITPRRDSSGAPVGYLLISKGISDEIRLTEELTDRERFERVLQEKNVELENANLSTGRFLSNMSHELRTPLNAIIGFTGTLLMMRPGPLNEEQTKQLQTIQSSGRRLLALINDLLALAKIESGKVTINIEPVMCQELIHEVRSTLLPLAEKKGLQFVITSPPQDVELNTDRRALSQILINLCNNAIKFTEQGQVGIELHGFFQGERGLAKITVRDTGIGIKPEDQVKLFQAFTQVGASGARRFEGTGLGLHLSQKLAELLGGRIGFESEYGNGSAFTLTLPAR